MTAQRDELSAYTYAKKRTVAAFLHPSATGMDEAAPSPLRAVVPGLITGALLLAGFGAWGMFKPQAPKDWARPGAHIVVGRESTTRYVVLSTRMGERSRILLHPVMNFSSARLLLDPRESDVVRVGDDILDSGRIPRGPLLGIPYAPDRLPAAGEAGRPKHWAFCDRSGGSGTGVQRAVLILSDRDHGALEGRRRLRGPDVLYVEGPDGTRHLVDAAGTKYRLSGDPGDHLTLTLLGPRRTPQHVSQDWLNTLKTGSTLGFPPLPGRVGAAARAGAGLTPRQDRVGMVLRAQTGTGPQHYVVLPGAVRMVSEFTAWLLINSPRTDGLDMGGAPSTVDSVSIAPGTKDFGARYHWPERRPGWTESKDSAGIRTTVCSVLRGVDDKGRTTQSIWAGPNYPVDVGAGGAGTYVTPGSGLLYTRVTGRPGSDGSLFLVTDTGLRYALRANTTGGTHGPSGTDGTGSREASGRPAAVDEARIRLGYGATAPAPVPVAWSELLTGGPTLDIDSARRPRSS